MKILFPLVLSIFLSNAVSASSIPTLSCAGTEPFWDLSINTLGNITYRDPLIEKKYSDASIKNAEGSPEGYAFKIEAGDTENGTLLLNVIKTKCNDGMSDTIYTYTTLVDINGIILIGCCN